MTPFDSDQSFNTPTSGAEEGICSRSANTESYPSSPSRVSQGQEKPDCPTASHPPHIPNAIENGAPENVLENAPENAAKQAPAHSPENATESTAPESTSKSSAILPETGFLPVLRNFNFLALWCGQIFSQIADKIYLVLMIAIITSRFQGAGQSVSGWVSALMIVFTIPAILFGFAAGVFVDRWSKKQVLVVTNLLRAGFVFALPLLMWLSADWSPMYSIPIGFFMLLGVTFLVSTITQFFAPAEQATIPLLVERDNLLSANSLYTTTMMAAVIAGFALGEPGLELADQFMDTINAQFGLHLTNGKEYFVGMCYALAGLVLLLIRAPDEKSISEPSTTEVWDDMKEGLEYLRDHPTVRSALIQLVILFSVFAALAVLAVRLAELIPTIDADQFGFLLAAAGLGMALGAVMIGQFGQRMGRSLLSLIGSVGMAICLGTLSLFTQQLWPALIIVSLLGGFAAIVGIPMQTTIQAQTPENKRGKVFGLQNNAVNIALSLPLALAGVAETLVGLPTVLLGLAGITLTGGLLTWYSSRKGSKQVHS
ncbi:MAG: MFS transporter [Leptolyngbyaceae bacterium]|nr:MFS transporter [Leptolyngbyaceae bacterium]